MTTEANWLGLTIRSESDQPHEWWCVGWAIRNRVLSKRYPNLYQAVVLSKKQFSYFNQFSDLLSNPSSLYAQALMGYAGDGLGWSENNLIVAQLCAADIIAASRWHAPFGTDVMHYWSPVSMKGGLRPPWANNAKRLFTPGNIDPARFVFAEGVA